MAIIKCPECGHQISDKAPTCPSCGVEIAGKVTKCPKCGEVFFSNEKICPNCHYIPTDASSETMTPPVSPKPENVQTETPPIPPVQEYKPVQSCSEPVVDTTSSNINNEANSVRQPSAMPKRDVPRPSVSKPTTNESNNADNNPKKKNYTPIIVSVVVAAIICAVCLYFYKENQKDKELAAYELAMKSSDPMDLKNFLAMHPDATQEQKDSINAHLAMLAKGDEEWTNALVSKSKVTLQQYLDSHPDSPHKQQVIHLIDSIDWDQALKGNTPDLYKQYLQAHADGEHAEEANQKMQKLNATVVQPEEKSMVNSVFRRYFMSLNSRDEGGLTSTLANTLTSFIGKSNATKNDVVDFMNKLYKDDVTAITWKLNNDYKITKREVGDEAYEYNVTFSAVENIDRTDDTKEKMAKFRIKAKISPDEKITEMSMIKIIE
jgi:hypothetical protein